MAEAAAQQALLLKGHAMQAMRDEVEQDIQQPELPLRADDEEEFPNLDMLQQQQLVP